MLHELLRQACSSHCKLDLWIGGRQCYVVLLSFGLWKRQSINDYVSYRSCALPTSISILLIIASVLVCEHAGWSVALSFICDSFLFSPNRPVEFCKSLVLWKVSWGLRRLRREEKRVQLEHCASLLAPSSNAVWVSCNREVANARAHYNRIIQRFTQSAVPLFCHLITSYWIGINLHCLSPNKQSS